MAGSLKDQLFKAGIASKKQIKQVELEKRKQSKQGSKPDNDQHAASVEAARQEKLQKDRALNQARKQAQAQRAGQAEIRQLVDQHRIRLPKDGDIRYYFISQGKVKQLWINADLQRQLASRRIALVCVDERFELVPYEIAERIIQRDPGAVIKEDTERRDKIAAEEAEYEQFQIPDDLDW